MVLDIQLFRKEQGGNPDLVRESQVGQGAANQEHGPLTASAG
jgi:hypothetical protein